jgi:hypothetical protein
MASKQKWLAELQSQVDALPYGTVTVTINRVNRHTNSVSYSAAETLRYTDNTLALGDIVGFLQQLVDDNHSGSVQFEVAFKEGQINLLAIKNTRETKY